MAAFQVTEADSGGRADVFVANQYPQFTRSALSALFDQGCVRVNDKPAKASKKLQQLDSVQVDDGLLNRQPALINLPIVYEDDNVMVINKPAGVLTHSKGALNTEPTVAGFIIPKVSKELTGNRAGIVHRLDRGTSGLIITAKTPGALTYLQKQFSSRRVAKYYLAVVDGVPSNKEALIDVPIARNPKKPQIFTTLAQGKTAQTNYRILKTFTKDGKQFSLLELKPLTGRTHQLRVHLKFIGHPIIGDAVYGHGGERLLLHAKGLELSLPGGVRKKFTLEPPAEFDRFLGTKSP